MEKPSVCWLTLNRACNLRCDWCYAKDTQFKIDDQMKLSDALEVIDLLEKAKIKKLTLIGGEPTLYPGLLDILDYSKKKNIKSTLVTNGVLLSDKGFLNELEYVGLDYVGLSLKGYNRKNFELNTQYDEYLNVMKAISNLSASNIDFSVSMVLGEETILNFMQGVKDSIGNGAKFISLSFCYDFSNIDGHKKIKLDKYNTPFYYIEQFTKQYEELNKITKGRFSLSQTFPLCLWDQEIINIMESRNQLSSVCQLLKHAGLIFGTDLSIIPCNAMYTVRLGKYKESFSNERELIEFWNKKEIQSFYNKVKSVPSKVCISCNLYSKCGGGCLSQWFNYSFDELMKFRTTKE